MEAGDLRHRVTLENPGPPIPDGEGGYTESWAIVGAARMPASIEPADTRTMERLGQDVVTASATHVVTIRYLSGVTTETRVTFHDVEADRQLSVTGRRDRQERHHMLTLFCVEAVS